MNVCDEAKNLAKEFPIKPNNIECRRINFDNFLSKFTDKKNTTYTVMEDGSLINEELANDLIFASLKLAHKNGSWAPFELKNIVDKIVDDLYDCLCFREEAMTTARHLIQNGIFVMAGDKIVFPFKTINLMYLVSPVSYGICITEV